MKKKHTQRGFPYYEFKDQYGESCTIQLSSLAEARCIWFGVDKANPMVLASKAHQVGIATSQETGWVSYPVPDDVQMTTRMHLSVEQVRELLPILEKFAKTGAL